MLNIVVPMAGLGSRFTDAGFVDPKPFISVGGIPMIELVIRNLKPTCGHRFVFVCQQDHIERYNISRRLQRLVPGCVVLGLPKPTAGAACTVLIASDYIDNNEPLMIANADQWVNIDIDLFLEAAFSPSIDGLIMSMPSNDPKWSFVQKDLEGRVCKVVEKEVVSGEATTGIYYFQRGMDFCREAKNMISNDERSRGEFYVAPVYTRLYNSGFKNLDTFNIGSNMHGLGTPTDLNEFIRSHQFKIALKKHVKV